MKKIIMLILAVLVGTSLFATTASADSSFNSPGAMPTITVTNATTNPCSFGAIDGCWKTSASAQPGDHIAVHLYYKNTSSETAKNVTLSIHPVRNGNVVTFTGGVAASNGPRATGSAVVTLSQTTTITTLMGDQRPSWYSSENSGPQEVNTDTLYGSSGFAIGDVPAGREGTLVVRYIVDGSVNTPPTNPGTPTGCTINSFSASDTSIQNGDASTLNWSTSSGCQYVTIGALGQFSAVGSQTVYPKVSTTYMLTAYPGGQTSTVTINVYNNNNGGNTNNYCTINSFYVDSNSISQGQTTNLRWNTSGASSVYISGFGSQNASGTLNISPYQSTNYTLSLNGNNCSGSSQSVYVTVGQSYNNGGNNYSQPQAITTVASVLGGYSAQLNGIAVPNSSVGTSSAWFEYGNTSSLGSRTAYQTVNGYGSNPYNAQISGLVPGAAYYYRAVVQSQGGIAYGNTVRFVTTSGGTYTPPTRVVQSSTTTRTSNVGIVANSAPSLFKLQVDSDYDHMCIGGTVDYTVNYQNISSQDLQNSILRITFPGELTYASSSRGDYDVTDRTITISLGTVQAGEQGSVTVHAQVNSQVVAGKLAVITATMVYTNPVSHAQENAIAYSLITVSNDCPSVLGASVFGFSSFLPQTLLQWLLLILVILALIVLARTLSKKKEEPAKTA